MPDYIELEKVRSAYIKAYHEAINGDGDIETLDIAFDVELQSIPAADVRPVVRGKWVDAIQNCGESPHVKCSVCGEYYWRYFKKFNYCPNCGAEMKGEADGT